MEISLTVLGVLFELTGVVILLIHIKRATGPMKTTDKDGLFQKWRFSIGTACIILGALLLLWGFVISQFQDALGS